MYIFSGCPSLHSLVETAQRTATWAPARGREAREWQLGRGRGRGRWSRGCRMASPDRGREPDGEENGSDPQIQIKLKKIHK